MVASKPLIALALLSGANALVAPQQRVLKTVMASTPVEESAAVETAPAAPMTTLEAAVLEATGTEPAAVAPAPVAAPPVAPAAPPPAPKAASPRSARRTGPTSRCRSRAARLC